MTSTLSPTPHIPLHTAAAAPVVVRRTPYRLGLALAAAAASSAGLSLAFPGELGGADVGRGNMLGTAVVVELAVVVLLLALRGAARGSARWTVVWGGATAYLLYQAVLFCFATPLNRFFLVYVAHLSLALWATIALARSADVEGFARRVGTRAPVRTVAAVAIGFAALNGLAWLMRVVPATFSDDPIEVLEGSGLLTNPVWVQDLAFWVPAMVLAGVALGRRRPAGMLATLALLAFFVVECVSIAADQWWGSRLDPDHPALASMTAVPLFLVLAVVTAVPLAWFLRHVDRA